MRKLGATILGLISIGFVGVGGLMIAGGAYIGEVQALVLLLIAVIALGTFAVATHIWTTQPSMPSAVAPQQSRGRLRIIKILFGSYAIAFSISMLILVFGIFLFSGESINSFFDKYMGYVLLGITIVCLPIVNRYME